MDNTTEKKSGSVLMKFVFGLIILSTIVTIYLTIKLIYYGFTFR